MIQLAILFGLAYLIVMGGLATLSVAGKWAKQDTLGRVAGTLALVVFWSITSYFVLAFAGIVRMI